MNIKKYVPNDVFKYRVNFEKFKEIIVYVKPFPPLPNESDLSWEQIKDEFTRREELVKEKYFTKEKIDELKKEFIKMIEETENPFLIYCYDEDSEYNVSEDELFNLE